MGIMDISEVEENLFAASDAKLHGSMCKVLSAIYCRVFGMFPVLESARPQSKSGIQALCSLHVALEKAKTILQHCSDYSKLYLAITGDSVVLKFEKARSALADSLRRVEDIVPASIGCEISEIASELDGIVFSLDPSEKQIGDQIIALLQQGRKFDVDCSDHNKLELFHQAALRLGITSSRAALIERRSLKKLIERARVEEDKRKEAIVAYLLHLMRKYSKLFRSELGDEHDSSQGSSPRSPTLIKEYPENGGPVCERAFSRLSSFNFKPNINNNYRRSGNLPLPPEELRCPISLQLMYDPVIIDSGQTYERVCIEKWFSDNHNTCPKTQQHLSHLCLTPNYCVKGLISSWCEQNGVPIPGGPPDSLDLNYWRLALSETDSMNSHSIGSVGSCKLIAAPLQEESRDGDPQVVNVLEKCESFLAVLSDEREGLMEKCRVVEHLRNLLKDDDEARILMGRNGFVEALVGFLESALAERNELGQEIGAMALFNLAVNNNRNKETMSSAGVIGLLEKMSSPCCRSHGSATALYLNLSCLEEAKPAIGNSSIAVPFLVKLLEAESESPQCKVDALHTLYNLSTHLGNVPSLVRHGIVSTLCELLRAPWEAGWTEKSIGVLMNVGSTKGGREEMRLVPGVIRGLAGVVEGGSGREAEEAAGCLLVVCSGDERCSQLVLQEGVIPALVDASVNGSARGKERAQKLLMLFREQRQREIVPEESRGGEGNESGCGGVVVKRVGRSSSRRRVMGRAWSSLWKSKSTTTYQC